MCNVLKQMGSEIIGYSLDPPTDPNLYSISGIDSDITSIIGDVRDYEHLLNTVQEYSPDIIIHMAAQPLVDVGYSDPRMTYESNVMGTVNILESIRHTDSVKSFLNVTTDKAYCNNEWPWGYRETDELNGYDPYSNSKSCSELVTSSYKKSFFDGTLAVSTARAGNVIGGGDFTDPRLIPDCVRAALEKKPLILRNPKSTRPYQHVLEPICAYLMIAKEQYEDISKASSYNIGPRDDSCVDNETLVGLFKRFWGDDFEYEIHINPDAPHEANFLKLDCSKIQSVFGWGPIWNVSEAVEKTVEWTKAYQKGNQNEVMATQINYYLSQLKI